MSTLQAALAWAEKGFRVFPLRELDKEPLYDGWHDMATCDPVTIRQLWTDPVLKTEHEYNVGCLCTDMVVIDIDVKDGKNGIQDYAAFGGHYDTLVVQTPTGGFHCYFLGPDSSNSSLSPSVDVRSHNGYVVAPGSKLPAGEYKLLRNLSMCPVPMSIEQHLKPPYFRSEREANVLLDSPASIEAAIGYLQHTDLAVQGARGDETTFITAARLVRELALSPETAWDLMCRYWNDRCSPPWDHDELWGKVCNAYEYGTAEMGRVDPNVQFAGAIIPPPITLFHSEYGSWGNAKLPLDIPPRPWLIERMLMTGAVTVLMATGSTGKSSLSLTAAAHLVLGLDFAGYKTRRPCKVVVYNGEDDTDEQSRRLFAVCFEHGFDFNEVKNRMYLMSRKEIKLSIADKQQGRVVVDDLTTKHLIDFLKDPEVGLIILDPLVGIHKCEESNNVEMATVMDTLIEIAQEAKVAIMALHHTSKGGDANGKAGNMDIARGASSIMNAARIGFTLTNPTDMDLQNYALQDNDRHLWVRMDDAKMNFTLASDEATWFKKSTVLLPNGDFVGALKHEKLSKDAQYMRNRIAQHIIDFNETYVEGKGSSPVGMVVTYIRGNENLWANKTETEIKGQIKIMFSHEVQCGARSIQYKRDASNKEIITVR